MEEDQQQQQQNFNSGHQRIFPRNPSEGSLESSFSRLRVSSLDDLPGFFVAPNAHFNESAIDDYVHRSHERRQNLPHYMHYSSWPINPLERSYSDPFLTSNRNGPVPNWNGLNRGPPRSDLVVARTIQDSARGNLGNRKPLNYSTLEDCRGKIVSLAKDQSGCEFLQKGICSWSEEQIKMVFLEVIDHVCELMVDPCGNYVVQKIVERCNEGQRTRIVMMLTKTEFQLVTICLNMHGSRAVQHLLSYLNPQQVYVVVRALRPGAVALTKSMNGHHVIQHCLKHLSYDENKCLLMEVADNCYEIATDKSGCCVLQTCVECSQGKLRDRLVAEITVNAVLLAEHCYGNYVIQHVLGLRALRIRANLLKQLQGSYAVLSRDKYGSNVVEKCLLESTEEQSKQIIMELVRGPDASMLLVDQFGNYVIQLALTVSKGEALQALLELVHWNVPTMRSNMYGKKVLAWIENNKMQRRM